MQAAGVVLAGGRGTRFGGRDKGLLMLNGQPMIHTVLSRYSPQVNPLAISANRNLQQYRQLGYPVLADYYSGQLEAFAGPLAGVITAMHWTDQPWLACVPCDMPCIPVDLVARLFRGLAGAPAAYVNDGHSSHYLCCLLSASLKPGLEKYLHDERRSVHGWLREVGAVAVDFSDSRAGFCNINTFEKLQCIA